MDTWVVLSIIRLIIPIGILRWPILMTVFAAFIDFHDYHQLSLQTEADYELYGYWDKFFDIYYLSFAAYTVLDWQDTVAKWIGLASYWFRLVGVVLFFILGNEIVLFQFPNYFQNLFLFYLIFQKFLPQQNLFNNVRSIIFINLALFIPIVVLEYILHVLASTPSEILQHIFGLNLLASEITANIFAGLLFIGLPFSALIWKLHEFSNEEIPRMQLSPI